MQHGDRVTQDRHLLVIGASLSELHTDKQCAVYVWTE